MHRIWTLLAALACLSGCQDASQIGPVEAGRRAYLANCIACHHMDPRREGTLGPPIAGSSRALLEARIVRAEYPPGYVPKRDTSLMPAQPFLRDQLDALAAYLAAAAEG